ARDWLPILEAGLANLTVGVIPPALDQVLIGAIDRSRNPDIKLALILGLNETIFPAPPEIPVLLTDTDRLALEKRQVQLGSTSRHQLSRERYYAYIACTRARQRVVLTAALQDAHGAPLNPSPFLSQVRQLFPALPLETLPKELDWRESEHASELIQPLLKLRCLETAANPPPAAAADGQTHSRGWEALEQLPGLARVLEQLRHFRNPQSQEQLSPELAAQLYGPVLRTSVSRMEQFAACPFKFFVHSGLRAEERKKFELDIREQGTFQHDVLALFHEQLHRENKRWRDITPQDARQRVAKIAKSLMASYRDGLLEASEQTRFMARILSESLQDFVETLVDWMRQQYQFEPVAVELPFGEDQSAPAWTVRVRNGHQLELYGRIDRVDLCRDPETGEALCVVLDYKSSQKQLDPILMAHGLQLQLLAYLNVMRHWPNPRQFFGVKRLIPVGVFYVNLRGKYDREHNRLDALADTAQARKLAYRHTGRFDAHTLNWLDSRTDVQQGDQF
ncbi:MAG TPA: PD-(D/E)XK nuclease family protein, partial [Candidatus Sulfotelmatobacter sp.]|nr:PD-(D/E)XK nuclease family protein [Candidatus Sulfotelmatobacter sp.]